MAYIGTPATFSNIGAGTRSAKVDLTFMNNSAWFANDIYISSVNIVVNTTQADQLVRIELGINGSYTYYSTRIQNAGRNVWTIRTSKTCRIVSPYMLALEITGIDAQLCTFDVSSSFQVYNNIPSPAILNAWDDAGKEGTIHSNMPTKLSWSSVNGISKYRVKVGYNYSSLSFFEKTIEGTSCEVPIGHTLVNNNNILRVSSVYLHNGSEIISGNTTNINKSVAWYIPEITSISANHTNTSNPTTITFTSSLFTSYEIALLNNEQVFYTNTGTTTTHTLPAFTIGYEGNVKARVRTFYNSTPGSYVETSFASKFIYPTITNVTQTGNLWEQPITISWRSENQQGYEYELFQNNISIKSGTGTTAKSFVINGKTYANRYNATARVRTWYVNASNTKTYSNWSEITLNLQDISASISDLIVAGALWERPINVSWQSANQSKYELQALKNNVVVKTYRGTTTKQITIAANELSNGLHTIRVRVAYAGAAGDVWTNFLSKDVTLNNIEPGINDYTVFNTNIDHEITARWVSQNQSKWKLEVLNGLTVANTFTGTSEQSITIPARAIQFYGNATFKLSSTYTNALGQDLTVTKDVKVSLTRVVSNIRNLSIDGSLWESPINVAWESESQNKYEIQILKNSEVVKTYTGTTATKHTVVAGTLRAGTYTVRARTAYTGAAGDAWSDYTSRTITLNDKLPSINAFNVYGTNIDDSISATWESENQSKWKLEVYNGATLTNTFTGVNGAGVVIPKGTIKFFGPSIFKLTITYTDMIGVDRNISKENRVTLTRIESSASSLYINNNLWERPINVSWQSTNQSKYELTVFKNNALQKTYTGTTSKNFDIPKNELRDGLYTFKLRVAYTGAAGDAWSDYITKDVELKNIEPGINDYTVTGTNIDSTINVAWVSDNQNKWKLEILSGTTIKKTYAGTTEQSLLIPAKAIDFYGSATFKLTTTYTNSTGQDLTISKDVSVTLTRINATIQNLSVDGVLWESATNVAWESENQSKYEVQVLKNSEIIKTYTGTANKKHTITAGDLSVGTYTIRVRVAYTGAAGDAWSDYATRTLTLNDKLPSINTFNVYGSSIDDSISTAWESNNQSKWKLEVYNGTTITNTFTGTSTQNFVIPKNTIKFFGPSTFKLTVTYVDMKGGTADVVKENRVTLARIEPTLNSLFTNGVFWENAIDITWQSTSQSKYEISVLKNNEIIKTYTGTTATRHIIAKNELRAGTYTIRARVAYSGSSGDAWCTSISKDITLKDIVATVSNFNVLGSNIDNTINVNWVSTNQSKWKLEILNGLTVAKTYTGTTTKSLEIPAKAIQFFGSATFKLTVTYTNSLSDDQSVVDEINKTLYRIEPSISNFLVDGSLWESPIEIAWESLNQSKYEIQVLKNMTVLNTYTGATATKHAIVAGTLRSGAYTVRIRIAYAGAAGDAWSDYVSKNIVLSDIEPSIKSFNVFDTNIDYPIVTEWESSNQTKWKLEVFSGATLKNTFTGAAEKTLTIPATAIKFHGAARFRLSVIYTDMGSADNVITNEKNITLTRTQPIVSNLYVNSDLWENPINVTWQSTHQNKYELQVLKNNSVVKTYTGTSLKTFTIPANDLTTGLHTFRVRVAYIGAAGEEWSDYTSKDVTLKDITATVANLIVNGDMWEKPVQLSWSSEYQQQFKVEVLKNNEVLKTYTGTTATRYTIPAEQLSDGLHTIKVWVAYKNRYVNFISRDITLKSTYATLKNVNVSGSNIDLPIMLSWESTDQQKYEVAIYKGDTITKTYTGTTATNLTIPISTLSAEVHIFKVRVAYKDRWTEWQSVTVSLIETLPAIGLLEPDGRVIDRDAATHVFWTSQNQTSYKLTLVDGNNATKTYEGATQTEYMIPAYTLAVGKCLMTLEITLVIAGKTKKTSKTVEFIVQGKPPTPTFSNTSTFANSRPVFTWDSNDCNAYELEVVGEYASGWKIGMITTLKIGKYLKNGDYTVRLRVKNKYGIASDYAYMQFKVNATTPTAPGLKIYAYDTYNVIDVTGENMKVCYIYRNGIRIGHTTDRFIDYTAHGQSVYYAELVSYSDIVSYSNEVHVSNSFEYPALSHKDRTLEMIYSTKKELLSTRYSNPIAKHYLQGTTKPFAVIGEHENISYSFSYTELREEYYMELLELTKLKEPLLYRSHNLKAWLVFDSVNSSDYGNTFEYSINAFEIQFDEGVGFID